MEGTTSLRRPSLRGKLLFATLLALIVVVLGIADSTLLGPATVVALVVAGAAAAAWPRATRIHTRPPSDPGAESVEYERERAERQEFEDEDDDIEMITIRDRPLQSGFSLSEGAREARRASSSRATGRISEGAETGRFVGSRGEVEVTSRRGRRRPPPPPSSDDL